MTINIDSMPAAILPVPPPPVVLPAPRGLVAPPAAPQPQPDPSPQDGADETAPTPLPPPSRPPLPRPLGAPPSPLPLFLEREYADHDMSFAYAMQHIFMTVYSYRYFNLQPHRPEALIELSSMHKVRFTAYGRSTEWHGSWRLNADGGMHIRFHYMGEEAYAPRTLHMWTPPGLNTLISKQDAPYPVMMVPGQAQIVPQPPILHADEPPLGFVGDNNVNDEWAVAVVRWLHRHT